MIDRKPAINLKHIHELAEATSPPRPPGSPLPKLHRDSPIIQAGDAYERVGATFEALRASGLDPPNEGRLVDFCEAVDDFERAAARVEQVAQKILHRKRQSEGKRIRWARTARRMAEYRQVLGDLAALLHARRKSGGNCP
jgi:hypothetical protein